MLICVRVITYDCIQPRVYFDSLYVLSLSLCVCGMCCICLMRMRARMDCLCGISRDNSSVRLIAPPQTARRWMRRSRERRARAAVWRVSAKSAVEEEPPPARCMRRGRRWVGKDREGERERERGRDRETHIHRERERERD